MRNTVFKMVKLVSAALLLVITAATIALAQNYSVPKKLPLERATKRALPSWFQRGLRYPLLIPEQFFPIGWSRDGKFAYYVEPVDEACGCYFAHLVIQDMRTDKVLWEFKYNQDEALRGGSDKMAPEDNIYKLWKKNVKLFSEKLAEHKIVAGRSTLVGKTFSAAGRTYTARALKKMGKNPDYGEERVDKLSFTLTNAKLGTKTLYSSDHSKEEYWFMLDAGVLGVIKSPFEERVAVISMEVMRGWEGPPHTGDIVITGADLTSGFPAK